MVVAVPSRDCAAAPLNRKVPCEVLYVPEWVKFPPTEIVPFALSRTQLAFRVIAPPTLRDGAVPPASPTVARLAEPVALQSWRTRLPFTMAVASVTVRFVSRLVPVLESSVRLPVTVSVELLASAIVRTLLLLLVDMVALPLTVRVAPESRLSVELAFPLAKVSAADCAPAIFTFTVLPLQICTGLPAPGIPAAAAPVQFAVDQVVFWFQLVVDPPVVRAK